MNLELRDNLDMLCTSIGEFMEYIDDNHTNNFVRVESEYSLLEDESGISNTDLDNLILSLDHVLQLVVKVK